MMHLLDKEKERRGNVNTKRRSTQPAEEDLQLVLSAKKDVKAAERLLARLSPRVRHAVYMAVGKDQEADDLTHVCLVEILENLDHFKGTGPLEAWASRLSYRVLMRHLSRRRRAERTVSLVPNESDVTTSTPESESERARLRMRLAYHLQKLPPERRITLILRLIEQYSVAEVAELTGSPINTVRDRIRTGLKELRQSILRDPETKEFLDRRHHG
jgi:RNA polymerase sigma-70 factor (ECF subfamily)